MDRIGCDGVFDSWGGSVEFEIGCVDWFLRLKRNLNPTEHRKRGQTVENSRCAPIVDTITNQCDANKQCVLYTRKQNTKLKDSRRRVWGKNNCIFVKTPLKEIEPSNRLLRNRNRQAKEK